MKAADLLGINDRPSTQVEVPEWGTTLTIRSMTLSDSIKLADMAGALNGSKMLKAEQIASVVAWVVVDEETGERIFSDKDVPALAQKSSEALMRIYNAWAAFNKPVAKKK